MFGDEELIEFEEAISIEWSTRNQFTSIYRGHKRRFTPLVLSTFKERSSRSQRPDGILSSCIFV